MIAVERLAIIWCEGVKISLKNFSLSRIRISSPFAVNITESRKLVPKLVLKPGRALKHPHRTNLRSTSFPRVALTRVGVKSDTANRETAPHHRRASLSDYFFLRRTKKKYQGRRASQELTTTSRTCSLVFSGQKHVNPSRLLAPGSWEVVFVFNLRCGVNYGLFLVVVLPVEGSVG
jgi:hypothetical protein